MKIFADAAVDAMEAGTAIVSGALDIACDPPLRVWGGHGTLELEEGVFEGVGDRGLVQVSGGAIGGSEQNITVSLSGVDPDTLTLLEADEVRDAPAVLWRLIFDGSGTQMLDAHVFRRGRLDQLITDEAIGGQATISAQIEGAARGLGRRGGRVRPAAGQRLGNAAGGGVRAVSYAGKKMLYWGGQRPATAGSALGGSRTVGTAERSAADYL